MSIQYSIIRFVPDSARGESVNVGLVAVDTLAKHMSVHLQIPERRMRAFAAQSLVRLTAEYLNDWKAMVEGYDLSQASSEVGEWLRTQYETSNNLVQFSPPTPTAFRSLGEALSRLESLLLTAEDAKHIERGLRRSHALAELRRAYYGAGLKRGQDFVERPTIGTRHHREVMDFAVRKGKAVQIAQSWSFQQRNVVALSESIRSWAWTIRDIRERGGFGEVDGRSFAVPKDVAVAAIYVEPDTAQGGDALADALYAFREVGAKALPENRARQFARSASIALQEAHAH